VTKFLSPEWFTMVEEFTQAAQGLDIPKAMKDVVVNLTVAGPDGEVQMRMDRGLIRAGHAAQADVLMRMPADYALRILVAGDWSVGMKGYIARKITLSGTMRKLIPLQVFKPTPSQEALRRRIEQATGQAGEPATGQA
jgi:hypothetical protein